MEFIKNKLKSEINVVWSRIKEKKIKIKTITLKAKYADFTQITRSKTLNGYISDEGMITNECFNLIRKTEIGRKKIRLIGVSLSNFKDENHKEQIQLELQMSE